MQRTTTTVVGILRGLLPHLEDQLQDLLNVYGPDGLSAEAVLTELAGLVTDLLGREELAQVEDCFEAVEVIASEVEEGQELVAYHFLSELPVGCFGLARTFCGEVTDKLAERIFNGEMIDEVEPGAPAAATESPTPTASAPR